MPLADTSAALGSHAAASRAGLQEGIAKLVDVLDNHFTQIESGLQDVAAVASIADHPAM